MTVVKIFENNQQSTEICNNKNVLGLASMCTNCNISYEKNKIIVEGEATEKAIVEAKIQAEKENVNNLNNKMKKINEIPFDSKRKLMTTIYKKDKGYKVITKGAPDVLIDKCSKIYLDGQVVLLDNSNKNKIIETNNEMANEALRVIAVAYIDKDNLPEKIDENLENNLIFVGLIGMIDPPRKGVKEAIKTCKRAGIKTVMITRWPYFYCKSNC